MEVLHHSIVMIDGQLLAPHNSFPPLLFVESQVCHSLS